LLVIGQKLIGLLKRSRIREGGAIDGIFGVRGPHQESILVFSKQALILLTASIHTARPGITRY